MQREHQVEFLGAFAKLRKATISFVLSVCPSARPPGTTGLPMNGFLWYMISEDFWKPVEKIQVSFKKSDTNNEYFTWRPMHSTFIIFRSVLLRKIVSDKSCRENQNTLFLCSITFFSPENHAVYDTV